MRISGTGYPHHKHFIVTGEGLPMNEYRLEGEDLSRLMRGGPVEEKKLF